MLSTLALNQHRERPSWVSRALERQASTVNNIKPTEAREDSPKKLRKINKPAKIERDAAIPPIQAVFPIQTADRGNKERAGNPTPNAGKPEPKEAVGSSSIDSKKLLYLNQMQSGQFKLSKEPTNLSRLNLIRGDSLSRVVTQPIIDPRIFFENEIRSAPDQGALAPKRWQRELTVNSISYVNVLFFS